MIKRGIPIKFVKPMRGKIGRPTVLSPYVKNGLIMGTKTGYPIGKLCEDLGISYEAYQGWRFKYRDIIKDIKDLDEKQTKIYLSKLSPLNQEIHNLFSEIKKAHQYHIQECLNTIKLHVQGGDEHVETKTTISEQVVNGEIVELKNTVVTKKINRAAWIPAAWMLERTMPDEFGKNRIPQDETASQLADNIHSAIEIVETEEEEE